jgi:tetratricopeptide (TPR) repeat protein
MRTAVTRHLDEGTLLRLAARDLGKPEELSAEAHLAKCVACRTGFAAARRLDKSLTKLAKKLRSDQSGDDFRPDARYFEFVGRLLDVSGEAEEAAERILRAVRAAGDGELSAALRSLDGKPHRGFALLYAAQKADKLVAEDPNKALALARRIHEEAATLPLSNPKECIATPAPRQSVQAEAALLESQALLQKGEADSARKVIGPARDLFRESGDLGFGVALCDYQEGTAASFEKDYPRAQRLLKRSLAVFAEFGQGHLMGRANAALGTLFGQKGQHERALEYFDASLRAFESESDTGSHRTTMLLNNWATFLMRLGRFDEARAMFAKALSYGRRHNHASHLFFIRTGLAELDFRRGGYRRALRAFTEIVREASPLASKVELLFSRLYTAECHARLGSYGPMAIEIEALRRERQANPFAPSPALRELFTSVDQGTIDADLIAHVREYLQDEENGVRRAYRPLRRAGSRS